MGSVAGRTHFPAHSPLLSNPLPPQKINAPPLPWREAASSTALTKSLRRGTLLQLHQRVTKINF